MSIYTKSGDKGKTSLLGGLRVPKYTLRIAAIGAIDELNASIGVLRTFKSSKHIDALLERIQHELFYVGAELADPQKKHISELIHEPHVKFLENEIDRIETKIPKLKQFILPAGTPFAAHAHFARAICRRAERTLVKINKNDSLNQQLMIYINRLSDLLFMLAGENMWIAKKKDIIRLPCSGGALIA